MKFFYVVLLFLWSATSVIAQNYFDSFVGKLDVDCTCLPNKAPDDFRGNFLKEEQYMVVPHDCYLLKSRSLVKNIYGQDSYLRYWLSYYLFKDTTECKAAIERFSSTVAKRIDGFKYREDGGAKTTPMVVIFNSKNIFCLYGNCETELEPWESLKNAFIAEYAEKGAMLLIAKCGYVQWKTYDD